MLRRLAALVLAASLGLSSAASAAKPWYYPLLKLGPAVYHRFECVLWRESRSTFAHPNLGDNSRWGSSGLFQVEPILWDRWRGLARVHVPVWRATPYQQSLVVSVVYKHDGFEPWGGGCS